MSSPTTLYLNLDNPLPRPTSFAEYNERVRILCALFSASCTSSLRTAQRNALVGGSRTSKHLIAEGGWAHDLVTDVAGRGVDVVKIAKHLGLNALDEGDHVHIQGLPVTTRS